MTVSTDGFSPENMERIYHGQPALIEGDKPPEEALTPRQYEIAELLADSLSRAKIASRVYFSEATVRDEVVDIYKTLGISDSRTTLAGYFPLDSDDPILKGKFLSQLTTAGLGTIQALSTGKSPKVIEKEQIYARGSLLNNINYNKRLWPGNKGTTSMVRIANALRAGCIRRLQKNGSDTSSRMGKFSLPELVRYERFIQSLE